MQDGHWRHSYTGTKKVVAEDGTDVYKTRVTVDGRRVLLECCMPLEILAALAYDGFERKLAKPGHAYNLPEGIAPEVSGRCYGDG